MRIFLAVVGCIPESIQISENNTIARSIIVPILLPGDLAFRRTIKYIGVLQISTLEDKFKSLIPGSGRPHARHYRSPVISIVIGIHYYSKPLLFEV